MSSRPFPLGGSPGVKVTLIGDYLLELDLFEFYSLEDLLSDVGSDVARFYYLSKQTDQHLDFVCDKVLAAFHGDPRLPYPEYICSAETMTWSDDEIIDFVKPLV